MILYKLFLERYPAKSAVPILTLFTLDCVIGCRRAVILTETDIRYRPPFGKIISIPLKSIVSLRKARTLTGAALLAHAPAPGIRIVWDGKKEGEVFPLSVRDSDQFMVKLEKVVEKNARHRNE